MASSSNRCVTDATLWIDLQAGGVVEKAFALPYTWLAPDLVLAELLDLPATELTTAGLHGYELSGAQLLEVIRLRAVYPGLSAADVAALVTARVSGAILVTGDSHLRRAADAEGVGVHGTLWVLDVLVRTEVLTGTGAAAALERMLRGGSRLPAPERRKRVSRWRATP
jgi:predicted nucleic acid-binding protein